MIPSERRLEYACMSVALKKMFHTSSELTRGRDRTELGDDDASFHLPTTDKDKIKKGVLELSVITVMILDLLLLMVYLHIGRQSRLQLQTQRT